MNADADRPPEEIFLDQMVEGYLDGSNADNPEPSANRSASYRHGFANGRDDLAHSPRLPANMLRLQAEQAIREDVANMTGANPVAGPPRGACRHVERRHACDAELSARQPSPQITKPSE